MNVLMLMLSLCSVFIAMSVGDVIVGMFVALSCIVIQFCMLFSNSCLPLQLQGVFGDQDKQRYSEQDGRG